MTNTNTNINTNKNSKKKNEVIINFMPSDLLKELNTDIPQRLQPFFSSLFNHHIQFQDTAVELLALDKILHFYSGVDIEATDFNSLRLHVESIQRLLYDYKSRGYVNEEIKKNEIFNIIRSFFVKQHNLFDTATTYSIFNTIHFHNLIILLLVKDLSIFINQYPKRLFEKYTEEIESDVQDCKNLRARLIQTVSAPLRSCLSSKRLGVLKRVYSGFDTEFQPLENKKVKLLAATIAVTAKSFFTINKLDFDFTVTNHKNETGNSKAPVCAQHLKSLILLIRLIDQKMDFLIDDLIAKLRVDTNLTLLEQKHNYIVSFKTSFVQPDDFVNIFIDYHNDDKPDYSLDKLVKESKLAVEQILKCKALVTYINELGILDLDFMEIKTRKELYLMAHYTPADVCQWTDFELVKKSFNILRKNFITLAKPINKHGFLIFLRDTSLLTPGAASLKAVGDLYKDLNKIDLPSDYKSSMEEFMEREPDLFKEYALRDAQIALYHSLWVEQSNYELCNRFVIPVSLSALASNYYIKHLKNTKYDSPVLNGKYSIKNLSRLLTPKGVELCGNLHEYIDYFLGAYHGGRNESFIYGEVPGPILDLDLPGAYATAMSLLDYPAYEEIEILDRMTSDEFIKIYKDKLIKSFSAFKIDFNFPDTVAYPNLPVRLDETSIIFPLKGVTFCTGLELELAINLGVNFTIEGGVFIPFENVKTTVEEEEEEENVPFVKKPTLVRSVELNTVLDELNYKFTVLKEAIVNISCHDLNNNNKDFALGASSTPAEATLLEISSSISEPTRGTSMIDKNLVESITITNDKSKKVDIQAQDITEALSNSAQSQTQSDLNEKGRTVTPFLTVVEELTTKRNSFAKKTYYNLLYKYIANAGIGQMARGLSQKKAFDTETESTVVVPSGPLTNPLYAGWVTSFIRTVLSEVLNNAHDQGVKNIISVTTDGFLCSDDINDIIPTLEKGPFAQVFLKARKDLGFNAELFEVKVTEPKGVLTWSTRGQLGLVSNLKAMTGYQPFESKQELVDKIKNAIYTDKKALSFIQFSLRSATDIFKEGGHNTKG